MLSFGALFLHSDARRMCLNNALLGTTATTLKIIQAVKHLRSSNNILRDYDTLSVAKFELKGQAYQDIINFKTFSHLAIIFKLINKLFLYKFLANHSHLKLFPVEMVSDDNCRKE